MAPKRNSEPQRRPAYPPSPTGDVRVRGKDDGCCGIFFLKNVLFVFNFILLLSGGAVLGVGLWTLLVKHSFVSLLASSLFTVTTYLLIITGGITIVLVFTLGCIGAWRENRCLLMTYAAFLLLVFMLEAATGVIAYLYENVLFDELNHDLNSTMLSTYGIDPEKTRAVDSMQQYGCVLSLEHFLSEHLIILGAVGLGLCCLQIFGIVFACCLAKKVKEWRERQRTYWR